MSDIVTLTLTNAGDHGTFDRPAEISGSELAAVVGEPQVEHEFTRDDFEPGQRIAAGWVHPTKRQATERARRLRRPDQFLPGRLRAALAIEWPQAPESVLEAQRAGHAAVTALEDAGRRVASLADEIEEGAIKHAAAAARAYAAGDTIPAHEPVDVVAETAIRAVVLSEATKVAEGALRDFRAARDAAQDVWLASLVAEISDSHSEFRATVLAAAKAARKHRAVVDGASRMAIETGKHSANWHQSPSRLSVTAAMAGLAALVEMANSEDPVVTGEFLTRTDDDAKLSPPAWTRAALARRAEMRPGSEDFVMLAQITDADKRGEVAACARGRQLSSPGATPTSPGRFDIV